MSRDVSSLGVPFKPIITTMLWKIRQRIISQTIFVMEFIDSSIDEHIEIARRPIIYCAIKNNLKNVVNKQLINHSNKHLKSVNPPTPKTGQPSNQQLHYASVYVFAVQVAYCTDQY